MTQGFDTERWHGVEGLVLVTAAAGVFMRAPPLLLLAGLGIVLLGYIRIATLDEVSVQVERELSDSTPDADDEVTVTFRVTNEGTRTLFDLRLVDGVPPALAVSDGTARLGTALRPGATASTTYTVTAIRGEHTWDETVVIARDPSGALERRETRHTETTMRCEPELAATADLPLRGLTSQYTGRVETDVPGSGLEFASIREYRHGDPIRRIDWNRRARTGELATVQFREERAATVVLVVDTRSEAHVAPTTDAETAVERCVDAASIAFPALLDSGDRVGVAAFGPEECWLPPSGGGDHRARARRLFATHSAFSPAPSDAAFFPSIAMRRLRRRLSSDAQVIFCSPLTDDYAVSVARRLEAYGHAVTVVSPDPTSTESLGARLARIERDLRLRDLRRAGVRVVDWGDEPLGVSLERAEAGWSR
ncbi:hypothetical protein C453_05374 [Haloferax elongans ATCC BAA-1513]|uniref:DUF58 domain-containing protein n=1 Tax=Haloferax elongans ATCC BAA-1513 TaxID=1230453 RepID=M0HTD9_HALEO|nr:DUF58 domain-containing protein [Haloferax elongans]ELZ87756.1 hypothetical protein C453_05374 [Haloferax elongans ATCC BAA-1513]